MISPSFFLEIVVYLYKMALKISFVKYEWLILITELRSRMQSLLNWELRTAFLKPIALHATHNYLNGSRAITKHLAHIPIWDIEFDVFLNNYDLLDTKFTLKSGFSSKESKIQIIRSL